MAKLTVCAWAWGQKYGLDYMRRLSHGVARNLSLPYDFVFYSPQAEDEHLTHIPGCFARLRMFDPDWQAFNGYRPGDRIVCLDLDLIVTGSLDPLFDRTEPFGILQGVNAANPGRFNGSVWWTTAGYRPDVWTDFSLDAAEEVPYYAFPDDQAWLEAKLPDAGALGPAQGAYAFKKPGWPSGDELPSDARLVAFPGHRDPSQFTHLDWVRTHWLNAA